MWPRIVELFLAGWLALSPWVFGHSAYVVNDWTCALVIAAAAGCSFYWPRVHLISIAIACWLMGFGYFASPYPTPAALQNDLVVGILLAMFAIIPSKASRPPESWQAYEASR